MARLHLLHLPGDRLALVVDRCDLSDLDQERVEGFARALGAAAWVAVTGTLDVADAAEPGLDPAAVAALALPGLTSAAAPAAAAKLPPPNTTEGKYARIWASRKDPQ